MESPRFAGSESPRPTEQVVSDPAARIRRQFAPATALLGRVNAARNASAAAPDVYFRSTTRISASAREGAVESRPPVRGPRKDVAHGRARQPDVHDGTRAGIEIDCHQLPSRLREVHGPPAAGQELRAERGVAGDERGGLPCEIADTDTKGPAASSVSDRRRSPMRSRRLVPGTRTRILRRRAASSA